MRFFISFCLVIISFSAYSYGINFERIKGFHSEINIQEDGSVEVTERIQVLVKGITIKRGIYRDIPLNFELPEGEVRQVLEVQNVKRNGREEPYRTELIEGGIRIYIGSKSRYLMTGDHFYELSYTLDRTVYEHDDVAELLWNVNGNQWDYVIDTLSAVIRTPKNSEIIEYDGWTGSYGNSTTKNFKTKRLEKGVRLFMSNKLSAQQNLTVGLSFSRDVMKEPGLMTRFIYTFRDYAFLILGFTGLILTFALNFILWYKFGVDPKEGTIIPQYYPPNEWSPAEISFLINEGKADENFFASQLLQLAVKGYVKITKSSDSFTISLTQQKKGKHPLTELEKGFLNKLLGRKSYIVLSKKHNPRVEKAHSYLVKKIEERQKGKYYKKNRNLIALQYIIPVITIVAMFFSYHQYEGRVWIIPIAAVLFIIMNVIFVKLFYQPTKEGRKILDHIMGHKRYIKYADELRINAVNKPDMNFQHFEKNLPYAIAYGMADKWAKQFPAKEFKEQYKSSSYYVPGYSFHRLAFLGVLSSTVATASVPPSAAGSAGGGFSGGGFSGGGAGGGGGGGW